MIAELVAQHGHVVIIIDEYDKPIIDHIGNPELAVQMRGFMKSFYGTLKDAHIEANLRFLFMTGVSKFSKISVFSELNNLDDLTLDERAATLCGYTQQELELVFHKHIDAYAQHTGITTPEMLDKLKYWYNGYKFSKSGTKVYNPFSVLNCLNKKDFANYWFASGTPIFITHCIQKIRRLYHIYDARAEQITISQMDKLSLETYFQNMILLFLQAGYLTIESFDERSQLYQLAYPTMKYAFYDGTNFRAYYTYYVCANCWFYCSLS